MTGTETSVCVCVGGAAPRERDRDGREGRGRSAALTNVALMESSGPRDPELCSVLGEASPDLPGPGPGPGKILRRCTARPAGLPRLQELGQEQIRSVADRGENRTAETRGRRSLVGSQVAADRVDLLPRAAAVSRTRSVPCLGRFQNPQPASHHCTASRGHVEGGCSLRWPRAPCRLLRVFSPEPTGRVLMTGLDCSEISGGPLVRRVTGRPRPPAVHLKPAGWALAPSRRGEAGARAGPARGLARRVLRRLVASSPLRLAPARLPLSVLPSVTRRRFPFSTPSRSDNSVSFFFRFALPGSLQQVINGKPTEDTENTGRLFLEGSY